MPQENFKTIHILKKYYDEIEKIIAHSPQFADVSEYVNFVLKELLFGEQSSEYSAEQEEAIQKRLQDLGYL